MILAPRSYENPEEQRLHERLNEQLGKVLGTVDAATQLRTAPNEAKRCRSIVRSKLQEAGNAAMDAMAHSQSDKK